ncbi:MAG: ABC transporter substrate-binding protein [Lachnospiraceae bacterium]|nr:ABC transporter substrate-binding protein [Lachnospiraceae bacterium]
MKLYRKILALGLTAAMLGLTACGSSGADATSAAESESDTEAAEETSEEAADGQTYNIGICQLIQHPALDQATQGFKDAVTEGLGEENVNFDEQNANGDAATATTICTNFVAEDVDLILANATASIQAAAAATGDIPILGTSITDYGVALDIADFDGTVGGNISGTSDCAPLEEQASMMEDIFPDAQTIGILYCSAEPNSKFQADTVQAKLEADGKTVKIYTFSDSNDLASVTSEACDNVDALYIPTDNTAASYTETINNIALPAKTPIFAGEEGIMAGCGVATLSISYYNIGYVTGQMAVEILKDGADISTMSIRYDDAPVKKYNPAICEELGLTMPEDYEAYEAE